MNKFNNATTLLQWLLNKPYPAELKNSLETDIGAVEQCNVNGNNSSFIIIAESEAELQEVKSEYNLIDCYPETDEVIKTSGGNWRKRIYVFDDFGNGIIIYSNTPSDNEKHTE